MVNTVLLLVDENTSFLVNIGRSYPPSPFVVIARPITNYLTATTMITTPSFRLLITLEEIENKEETKRILTTSHD
ncbi:hypothetical protein GLYMA_19G224900v4 [Glycine max]|uniref:Uncharacterized protein n=1 Tax=Glycine max TaxID=3847 RepID=K7MZQ7_SOYBN|nr:hypothetical protein GYH30_053917 [Glycine max]KRG96665.1 hypothetical protein GLYMA_19G224900v4 [Glycine max]